MDEIQMQELINQSEKSRVYMRLYKQKKYAEDPVSINKKNRAYYYKNKYGLETSVLKKYDTLLPCVAKIKVAVDEFKTNNIDLSIEYLTELLVELRMESIKLRTPEQSKSIINNVNEILSNNLCV